MTQDSVRALVLKSTGLVFATCLRYESGSFFTSLLGSTMAKEIDQNLLVLNRQGLGRVEDVSEHRRRVHG